MPFGALLTTALVVSMLLCATLAYDDPLPTRILSWVLTLIIPATILSCAINKEQITMILGCTVIAILGHWSTHASANELNHRRPPRR